MYVFDPLARGQRRGVAVEAKNSDNAIPRAATARRGGVNSDFRRKEIFLGARVRRERPRRARNNKVVRDTCLAAAAAAVFPPSKSNSFFFSPFRRTGGRRRRLESFSFSARMICCVPDCVTRTRAPISPERSNLFFSLLYVYFFRLFDILFDFFRFLDILFDFARGLETVLSPRLSTVSSQGPFVVRAPRRSILFRLARAGRTCLWTEGMSDVRRVPVRTVSQNRAGYTTRCRSDIVCNDGRTRRF